VFESTALRRLHDRLLDHYGPQHWWPAEDAFEVMVGAVLVQNTAWRNVEVAIRQLKQLGPLSPELILARSESELAEHIRPSGYFNIKAHRLSNLCRWLIAQGGMNELVTRSTDELRESLLGINGVGPETADDILLYALNRPVFVVDAYTRRLFSRLDFCSEQISYEPMRATIESALTAEYYNELHALIVIHGNHRCRKRPRCTACPLLSDCPAGQSGLETAN